MIYRIADGIVKMDTNRDGKRCTNYDEQMNKSDDSNLRRNRELQPGMHWRTNPHQHLIPEMMGA